MTLIKSLNVVWKRQEPRESKLYNVSIYEDEQAGCTQNIVTHKQRIRQLFELVL